MKFSIQDTPITDLSVDAIVNSARSDLKVDYKEPSMNTIIHKMAGPQLAEECSKKSFTSSHVVITKGYALPAKFILHVTFPKYEIEQGHHPDYYLGKVYYEVLKMAKENGLKRIAFPVLGAGNKKFPPKMAMQIALRAITKFCLDNGDCFEEIIISSSHKEYRDYLNFLWPEYSWMIDEGRRIIDPIREENKMMKKKLDDFSDSIMKVQIALNHAKASL